MRSAIGWLLWVLVIGGFAAYLYETRPCAQPIYYSIGTFDTQFGISKATFLADAQKAASLWNVEAGHTVLAYSATGTMPLNLIFDARQQQADTGASLASQQADINAQKAAIAQMEAQHAPASEINARVDTLNAKIAAVNANVDAYNTTAGNTFEEGEFIQSGGSKKINLYEFRSQAQLERLIAHEFGHSLGLGHNADPDSIMYPENAATTVVLSSEDKAALQQRCAVTWQNLNPFSNTSLSSR